MAKNIVIEGAKLAFRNFSGKEGRFNPKGRRTFSVLLEDSVAQELESDGWNVRWLQPREQGDKPQAHMSVTVTFSPIPPRIILIKGNSKSAIDENSISMLDFADIESVDLIIRPYSWEMNGKKGIKAYLKAMYVTLTEDELESKYFDVPDSASGSIGGCGNCDICDGKCNHHD